MLAFMGAWRRDNRKVADSTIDIAISCNRYEPYCYWILEAFKEFLNGARWASFHSLADITVETGEVFETDVCWSMLLWLLSGYQRVSTTLTRSDNFSASCATCHGVRDVTCHFRSCDLMSRVMMSRVMCHVSRGHVTSRVTLGHVT